MQFKGLVENGEAIVFIILLFYMQLKMRINLKFLTNALKTKWLPNRDYQGAKEIKRVHKRLSAP